LSKAILAGTVTSENPILLTTSKEGELIFE
jgi:hypothetical protein